MRIKLYNLCFYLLLILIVINLQLLNFGDFARLYRYLTALISVILGMFCILERKVYCKIRSYCRFMNIWIVLMAAFMMLQVVYGWAVGGFSPYECVGLAYVYSWILLFYPIVYVISSTNGLQKLLRAIIFLTLLTVFMKTIVWWMFNYKGKDIMHYLLYEFGDIWLRNGRQRIPATCFSGILFAAAVSSILQSRRYRDKIISLFCILINIWYADQVFASRAQLIAFVIAICIPLLCKRNMPVKRGIVYIIFVSGAMIIVNTSQFREILNSFNLQTYSMGTRVKAMVYFGELFREHVLLGFTFVLSEASIRGAAGNFYLSDMGALGDLFGLGIAGFILSMVPFIRMVSNCYVFYKRSDKWFLFALSLATYTILFSMLSNNIYNFRLLFGLPFIMAFFEVFRNYDRNGNRIMDSSFIK